MTLYEFTDEYLKAFENIKINEETGEFEGFEKLEEIKGEFNDKAEAVACFIKELNAEAEAIKAEADKLADRAKSKVNKAERLKDYLAFNMQVVGTEKLETTKVALSFRKSESVEITDEFEIPEMYLNKTITFKPVKAKIKEAIKAGNVVPGATLVQNNKLQIK